MQTLIVTNNAFDSVLLLNDAGLIVSQWTVEPSVFADYLRDGANADEWDVQEPAGYEDQYGNPLTIEACGTEYGRNGSIESEERRRAWRL